MGFYIVINISVQHKTQFRQGNDRKRLTLLSEMKYMKITEYEKYITMMTPLKNAKLNRI